MKLSQTLQQVLLKIFALSQKLGLSKLPGYDALFLWAYFKYKRYFEDPFYQLLVSKPDLFKGGYILDVGANLGYTCWVFSKGISKNFKIYAFEPEPKNFSKLTRFIKRNHLKSKITPVQSAIGAKVGVSQIEINPNHHADHRIAGNPSSKSKSQNLMEVAIDSIDHFIEQSHIEDQICFIKIDVQGYELKVCEGMTRLIDNKKRSKPLAIAMEHSPKDAQKSGFAPNAAVDFLINKGFKTFSLDRNHFLKPVLQEDLLRQDFLLHEYTDLLFLEETYE